MMPPPWDAFLDSLVSLGGLGGVAAFVTSIRATRRHEDVMAEMKPDHGGSLRDAVDRIERGQDATRDALNALDRRVTRELVEIRRDARAQHADFARRIGRIEDDDA